MLHTLVSKQSSLLSKGAKLNKIPGPNWVWNSPKVQEDTHIELTIIGNPLAKKCKSTLPFENTLTPYHGIVWIPRIHDRSRSVGLWMALPSWAHSRMASEPRRACWTSAMEPWMSLRVSIDPWRKKTHLSFRFFEHVSQMSFENTCWLLERQRLQEIEQSNDGEWCASLAPFFPSKDLDMLNSCLLHIW